MSHGPGWAAAGSQGVGPLVEPGGEFVRDGGGAGGSALGPGQVVPGGMGQGLALQAAVQDADGLGAVHRRGGDLADQGGDVVPGELGAPEPLMQGLARVLAVVPPSFGVGEPGLDLLVDVGWQSLPDCGGPQGEQVAVWRTGLGLGGSAWRRTGRRHRGHDAGEDGFGRLAGRARRRVRCCR